MSKTSSKRDYPAIGRKISAEECGGNRHGRYACPDSCIHNSALRQRSLHRA